MKKILLTLLLVLAPFAAHAEYSRPYIGDMTEYRAKYEDTFVYLARDYNLGFVEMRAANPATSPVCVRDSASADSTFQKGPDDP